MTNTFYAYTSKVIVQLTSVNWSLAILLQESSSCYRTVLPIRIFRLAMVTHNYNKIYRMTTTHFKLILFTPASIAGRDVTVLSVLPSTFLFVVPSHTATVAKRLNVYDWSLKLFRCPLGPLQRSTNTHYHGLMCWIMRFPLTLINLQLISAISRN